MSHHYWIAKLNPSNQSIECMRYENKELDYKHMISSFYSYFNESDKVKVLRNKNLDKSDFSVVNNFCIQQFGDSFSINSIEPIIPIDTLDRIEDLSIEEQCQLLGIPHNLPKILGSKAPSFTTFFNRINLKNNKNINS